MIQLIYGQDKAVADWVQARLPEIRNGFGPCAAIGIVNERGPIAGVVYHEFRQFNLQMSMASESPLWCSSRTLRALLGYPFLQLMVARITVCTAKQNKKLRSLVERLGFQLEGRLRRGFDGTRDMLIYGMVREEAEQWITAERQRIPHEGEKRERLTPSPDAPGPGRHRQRTGGHECRYRETSSTAQSV